MLLRSQFGDELPLIEGEGSCTGRFGGVGALLFFLELLCGIGLRFCPLFLGGGTRQGFGVVVTQEQICKTRGLVPGRWSCSNPGPAAKTLLFA